MQSEMAAYHLLSRRKIDRRANLHFKMITRTDPSMLQTKQSVHILALFNRLYSFFTFIYTFIVKKSPSRHIVVAPG